MSSNTQEVEVASKKADIDAAKSQDLTKTYSEVDWQFTPKLTPIPSKGGTPAITTYLPHSFEELTSDISLDVSPVPSRSASVVVVSPVAVAPVPLAAASLEPAHSTHPYDGEQFIIILDQLKDLQTEHAMLRVQYTAECDARAATQQQLINLQGAHAMLQAEYAAECDAHIATRNAHTATQGQLTTLQTQYTTLQLQHTAECNAHVATRNAHTAIQGQLTTLQAQYATLQAQYTAECNAHAVTRNHLTTAQGQLATQAATINSLQTQLRTATDPETIRQQAIAFTRRPNIVNR